MNISDRIIDNHVQEFLPVSRDVANYPAHRVWSASPPFVESALEPPRGKKGLWVAGDKWKKLTTTRADGNRVLMITLRHNGQTRSVPLKRILWEAFVGILPPNHSIKCPGNDEDDVNLCNLEVVPGKYIRRTSLYEDYKK